MVIKEIQEYAQVRAKARAYLCYLISRHASPIGLHEDNRDTHVNKELLRLKDAVPKIVLLFPVESKRLWVHRVSACQRCDRAP